MICKYAEIFCWKNVSSFCNAKATHIFSAKGIRILYIESAKTVNEMTLNKLVKLTTFWTTGPSILKYFFVIFPRKQDLTFQWRKFTWNHKCQILFVWTWPNNMVDIIFFADFSPDNSHEKPSRLMIYMKCQDLFSLVVGWCEGVMYLLSPGRPADIGL